VEVFSMRRICLFLGVLLALAPSSARAQGSTPGLGGLLLRFFSPSNPVVLKANPVPAFSHDAHFVTQPNAQASLKQINSQLAAQISTFPIGSSSGGFTFTFDSSLGVYHRTTQSFGPLFAERPQTAGKGKFSAGVNFQNATYDRIEGQDLRNGDLKLFLVHIDTNNDHASLEPWFEGDIIGSTLSIDLQAKTTVFFANYGFTSKFDVGVAIPYQDISINARIDADITCGTVIVHGEVNGNIRAKDAVELHAPAKVRGDVETPSFSLEKGVVFQGQTTMPAGEKAAAGEKVAGPRAARTAEARPGPAVAP
jgi:hypothetical protein